MIAMNLNSTNRKNALPLKTEKLQLLFLLFLIVGCTQNIFAKKTTNHPYLRALTENLQPGEGVASLDLAEYTSLLTQGNNIDVTSKVNGGLILDSISVDDHFGIYTKNKRWTCFYTGSKTLTHSICRYYNGNFDFTNITETRTYDEVGHEIKLVCHQPDNSYSYRWDYDTTAIDLYTEENKYENGKIVQKDIVNHAKESYDNPTRQVKYYYNEKGQLTSRTETSAPDGLIWEAHYYYNKDGEIEFKVEPIISTAPGTFNIEKMQYQYSDSVNVITKSTVMLSGQLQESDLYSMIGWLYIYTFEEHFDSVNRKLSVTSHYFTNKEIPYCNAEYEFTENLKLKKASFSQWIGNADSGYYKETFRVDNLYDEFGNLLQHLETFYDDNFSDWSIKVKVSYYYSAINKSIETEKPINPKCMIYPNPAKDYLIVSDLFEDNSSYQLYNMHGKWVGCGIIENSLIDISKLKPGVYIVKIKDYTGRIVKN
jgi:hypothetical protein